MVISGEWPLSVQLTKSVEKKFRPGMLQWHPGHSHVLSAALRTALFHGEPSVAPWVWSMFDPVIGKDGSISGRTDSLASAGAALTLFDLCDTYHEERFMKAADAVMESLSHLPRTESGVFWHMREFPWQIWIEDAALYAPFMAEYGRRKGDEKITEDAVRQLVTVYETLRDSDTGLMYHAYDESRGQRWSDPETGLSPTFWSRAMGFYVLALLITSEHLNPESGDSKILAGIIRSLASSLLTYQDESGLWYQVTDAQRNKDNFPEVSASACFAVMYLRGVRLSILDQSYAEAGYRALDGIRRIYLTRSEDGTLHIDGISPSCGIGGNPYRDGSLKSYCHTSLLRDDLKGVVPLILALLEEEMARKS
ncbi:MAG: glycoside hydrolase family 105 protein [Bullifex sp.]